MQTIALPTPQSKTHFAFAERGFRPFFLGAGLWAIASVVLWLGIYGFHWNILPTNYPSIWWHMHEMIFGYVLAVIAGFALTAVTNWTQLPTAQGLPLMLLAALWLVARMLPFTPVPPIAPAIADLAFGVGLIVALAIPLLKRRLWKQLPVLGAITLLVAANAMFYAGLTGYWIMGFVLGIYIGFYTILLLIMVMGRRVIPFFIENGIKPAQFKPNNNTWLDSLIIISFIAFAIVDCMAISTGKNNIAFIAGVLAIIQALLHTLRLWGWYNNEIWGKSLLWSLFLGYCWLIVGFTLKYLSVVLNLPSYIYVHAFAYGTFALVTVSMMSRVALGHTGRNVNNPPSILTVVFILLFAGAFIRVFYPWAVPEYYDLWILVSQVIWIVAFSAWTLKYLPILVKPSVT